MSTGRDPILGTDTVRYALKTKVNDDMAELFACKAEVENARDGEVSLLAKEQSQDSGISAVTNEVVAARGSFASLADREDQQDIDIANALDIASQALGQSSITYVDAAGDGVTDDTAAIQNAIDYTSNYIQSTGMKGDAVVVLPHGNYKITSQIVVKPHVILRCDGVLYNYLPDKWEFAVLFQPGSHCERLQLWGNLGSGVQFGELSQYCDMLIGNVRLWNIGEEYDAIKGSKIAVKFRGYNFKFNEIDIDGGNIGFDADTVSDIRGDTVLVFTASTGARFTSACEHCSISTFVIDTPDYLGLQIDSSNDISLPNVRIFLNDNEAVAPLADAIVIGKYSAGSPINNLNLVASVQNTGGNVLSVQNIQDSRITLNIVDAPLETGNAHPITNWVTYGNNIDENVRVVIPTKQYASSVPTKSMFRQGDIIYNSTPVAGGSVGWICVRTGQSAPTWSTSTSYNAGDLIVPTSDNGKYYKCINAGTTGSTEPTWPTTVGATVTDGTVTWECEGTSAMFKTFGNIAT